MLQSVAVATAGTQVLAKAAVGRRVFLKAAVLVSVGGTVQFQDTDGTALTGSMTLIAGVPLALDPSGTESNSQNGWLVTNISKGLQVAAGAAVSGVVQLIQV